MVTKSFAVIFFRICLGLDEIWFVLRTTNLRTRYRFSKYLAHQCRGLFGRDIARHIFLARFGDQSAAIDLCKEVVDDDRYALRGL